MPRRLGVDCTAHVRQCDPSVSSGEDSLPFLIFFVVGHFVTITPHSVWYLSPGTLFGGCRSITRLEKLYQESGCHRVLLSKCMNRNISEHQILSRSQTNTSFLRASRLTLASCVSMILFLHL